MLKRVAGKASLFAAVAVWLAMMVVPGAQGAVGQPGGGQVAAGNGNLGYAVAIAGAVAVAGAPSANNSAGAAHIYAHTRRGWRQQAVLTDPAGKADDNFGWSVVVSGTTVVVGTTNEAVYVFVRSGSRWRLQAKLSFRDDGAADLSVAMFGETLIIGDSCGDGGAGAAYIYVRSGTKWHLRQTLDNPSDDISQAGFGEAVALSGSVAVIGNGYAGNLNGNAYVFTRSGSSWSHRVKLTEPHSKANDLYGDAVAVSGQDVMIGAFEADNGKGAVYAYAPAGRRWPLRATFTSPDHISQANFGLSISMAGRKALIGSPEENFRTCGTAYELTRSGSAWHEHARIINPHCTRNDWFGQAVAISGNEALIGSGHGSGIVYYTTLP